MGKNASMSLDSKHAQRLVEELEQAETEEEAVTRSARAWDFLLAQLRILRDRANGYPRNPIDGLTWTEGYHLAQVCDRFADAVRTRGHRSGEEQAAGLAAAIACEVVGHYPQEIFPRVLRTARCREANGHPDKAINDYLAIVGDFRDLELASILEDEEALQASDRCILNSLIEAVDELE